MLMMFKDINSTLITFFYLHLIFFYYSHNKHNYTCRNYNHINNKKNDRSKYYHTHNHYIHFPTTNKSHMLFILHNSFQDYYLCKDKLITLQ